MKTKMLCVLSGAMTLVLSAGCSNSSVIQSGGEAFEFTGSAQAYVVPDDVTSLSIVALGASGGDTETNGAAAIMRGGYGASVETEVSVTPGATLTIVVGEQPPLQVAGLDGCGGSGGGGTFVVADPDTPLVVAGGGGGSTGYYEFDGLDAGITEDGVSSSSEAGGVAGAGGSASYGGGGGSYDAGSGTISIRTTHGHGAVTITPLP